MEIKPFNTQRIGVVVIGRNEGQRLVDCLDALISQVDHIVYVDSGSQDNSIQNALERNVEVIKLDISIPFTAARARNAGFARLMDIAPEIEYVQFVDGDCDVVETWLDAAAAFLDAQPQVAVVCGRRMERYPDESIYNLMCDMEWNTPVGEAKACGGDAMMRVQAFKQVAGYRDSLIAGEEPELCVRLRKSGWFIERLDEEMTWHDAAMSTFKQWWSRTVRAGHAFAEGAYLHGAAPERHWVKETMRAWVWAFFIPLLSVVSMFFHWQVGLALLYLYVLQWVRLALKNLQNRTPYPWKLAGFNVIGKFAEFRGQLKFYHSLFTSKQNKIIEYK